MSRVYKGQDLELTTVLSVCQPSYENLELAFYTTDPDMAAVFSGDDITIDENKATVTIPSNILDIMDDGVLRGKVKYGEVVFDIPTTMYLKTPQGYTPIRPEEGVILIGKTITENGKYTPEEGYAYNNVVVDVPTGGDCPELEQEVEELTSQIAELNSQIDEKDAEIVSKDAEIAVLITEAEEAFDEGVRNQKAKLTSTTIRNNGTYTREDGWDKVEVNVADASDLYANTNQMFADMMLKMATYEYVSMYQISSGLNSGHTYTIPADSIAIVSSYERLEPFKTAGTFGLDNGTTLITLYSHNSNAIIDTTGHKQKISLYNTAPRIYAGQWSEIHLYHTECSNITLGPKTYCHTLTPPTLNGVMMNAVVYYPKGADYSSFIEKWSSVATILPFEY